MVNEFVRMGPLTPDTEIRLRPFTWTKYKFLKIYWDYQTKALKFVCDRHYKQIKIKRHVDKQLTRNFDD